MSDRRPPNVACAALRRASLVVAIWVVAVGAWAAEVADVRREFLAGNYPLVLQQSEAGLRESPGNIDWQMLRTEVLLATGRYAAADTVISAARPMEHCDVRIDPSDGQIVVNKGKTYRADKDQWSQGGSAGGSFIAL